MVETCVKLRREGHRVIIVSSGAIGIGLRRLDIDRRPKQLAAVQVCTCLEELSGRVCGLDGTCADLRDGGGGVSPWLGG